MNWKNIKLGKKFTIAFGSIIMLLIVVALWATTGINGIIGNAEEVIEGNKLKALLIQKEVDHLNWANAVSELINNEHFHDISVQTDHHKCGFGKWYYSDERKHAEELVPELKELLESIEEPHQHLHESAVKIQENYTQVDRELSLFLSAKRSDHIQWMNQARKDILDKKKELSIQKDPTKCGLGKWLNSPEVKEMSRTNEVCAEFLREIDAPHKALHEHAHQVDKLLKVNNSAAVNHLNTQCEPNAHIVLGLIDGFIAHNNSKAEQLDNARAIYANETMPALQTVKSTIAKMVDTATGNIMTDSQMLEAASDTSIGVILLSIVIAFIAILLAVVIARGIIIPMRKGVAFARKLSEGDLTSDIDIKQEDEIGQLASALNDMSERLREIVCNIATGATNIASASQQMSSTSQQMSQGASTQASSIEEVTSSMEEMSANIDQNTDNAQGTEKIASVSAKEIKIGSEATSVAVDGMKNIAEKIRIINDIAFQTNILALNAAVEAARAGEHGKGFAVVAAEVRKLAERSKVAADEIDELSRDGVANAEEAGEKLKEIVPQIEKTANLVQEIATASIEQRSGSEQINSAMQQLNNVTQQNAAASEEMATGSEELASQAEQLREVIQFFNIGQNQSNGVGTVCKNNSITIPQNEQANESLNWNEHSETEQQASVDSEMNIKM